jgi:hypothetical protein
MGMCSLVLADSKPDQLQAVAFQEKATCHEGFRFFDQTVASMIPASVAPFARIARTSAFVRHALARRESLAAGLVRLAVRQRHVARLFRAVWREALARRPIRAITALRLVNLFTRLLVEGRHAREAVPDIYQPGAGPLGELSELLFRRESARFRIF